MLLLLFWVLPSFLASFQGSNIVGALIAAKVDKARLSFSVALLVIFVWLITAIYQSPKRNLLMTLSALLFGIAIQQWYVNFYPQNFQDFFWTDILFDLSTPLTTVIVGFFAIRFNTALIDVLWRKSNRNSVRIASLVSVAIASAFGAYLSLSFRLIRLSRIKGTLSYEQQAVILLSGILLVCAIALSAWAANRLRNTPWDHKGFLHPLVLSVGCWRGTSFYNLDLSQISFRGANLSNSDLRARKLYRTCLQGVTDLEKAKIDSRYLDLELPKVQHLLTQGYSEETNFSRLNLRGAYLQSSDLRRLDFTDADLSGSDLKNADLRGAILARTNVTGVDFSDANLTGVCIQDWNVNRETLFTNVLCDYIYRKLDEKGEPTDRYPLDRNFDAREFESLYQEVGNVVDLVFKEGINWRAFAFTLQKLQIEDEGLGLELKGVEKRGDLWIVKVTHSDQVPTSVVEQHLNASYDRLQALLAAKEQQISRLLDMASDQAEAVKNLSKQSLGNSFFITGSTITNLAGSGQIEYHEAADQVRSLVTNSADPGQVIPTLRSLIMQLSEQKVATTSGTQLEFIQQLIVAEAEKDQAFKQFLTQHQAQIISAMPSDTIASAIQSAIQTVNSKLP